MCRGSGPTSGVSQTQGGCPSLEFFPGCAVWFSSSSRRGEGWLSHFRDRLKAGLVGLTQAGGGEGQGGPPVGEEVVGLRGCPSSYGVPG